MKSKPKLLRILTPPPIPPSSLLNGSVSQVVTGKALGLHLAKSVPSAAPRNFPTRLNLVTLHPCQPIVAYMLEPDGYDAKKQQVNVPKSIVVQHLRSREVLFNMSLGEMISVVYDFDMIMSRTAEHRQQKVLKDLGQLQYLEFFDPSTLYWSGNGEISNPGDIGQRWSYLLVQFTSMLLVVNLRRHSVSVGRPQKYTDAAFKPILAHITEDAIGSMITSNALPVTRFIIVVGANDGTMKLYDWNANVVIQSIRVVQNKSDSVVHIIATNKYGTPGHYSTAKRRIVCLTKKGSAFLMELQVTESIVHDITGPIAKFDGGSVPPSVIKQDDDSSSMDHVYVRYCGFRDLLLWSYPARTKTKLLVWDLGNLPKPDARQIKRREPVKPDPTLVMQFPYETSHTILPGWLHESVPLEAMTCAAVTKDGEFQILVAPLHNSGSTIRNPFSAVTIFTTNLLYLTQHDFQLAEERELHVRVSCVLNSSLRDSSTFLFGTNLGVMVIRMLDGNVVPFPGARHAHFNSNYGGLGKAILTAKGAEVHYSRLEPAGGSLAVNPIGSMETKNDLVVYESPPPLHLPPEIRMRPVRLPPRFLPSPSRSFVCLFWKEEMRYEVLHIGCIMDRVSSRGSTAHSPVVTSGNGVASFAWVGDDDVFCLLYNPEQDLALKVGIDLSAPTASLGKELANAAYKITDITRLKDLSKLKELASLNTVASSAKAVVGTAGKLKSLEGLREIASSTREATMGTGKAVSKAAGGAVKLTGKVAFGTVKGTTKLAVGGVKGTKLAVGGGTKLTVGTFGRKAKSKKDITSDVDSIYQPRQTTALETAVDGDPKLPTGKLERRFPWVELRAVVRTNDATANSATTSNLGELSLRSSNRNPPTILFGGPVLCVGSKLDDLDEGLAYFYTRKRDSDAYVSSGPAFPCPDIVTWDEDGRLCAVVIHSRVSIYLSDEPDFVMLGTVRLGSSADIDVEVISVKFIHGVLYCTTRSSVQCIFLGDLEGGVCHLDTLTLASSDVSTLPSKTIVDDYAGLTPPTIPMPLNHPTVLGYQNGSLMLSTVSGIQAIPLGFPLLRIGSLIGAGHIQRAERWFDAVPLADHEALATFLERRGFPELALKLAGVSLETNIDICMKYGFVDRLEEAVDLFGLKGLRTIDMSRGVSSNINSGPEDIGTSVVVCIGAYLLSHGKVELVRRLATECLSSGEVGKREAFVLASLLLSIDGNDAKRLIKRAVDGIDMERKSTASGITGTGSSWLVGAFVHDHVLSSNTGSTSNSDLSYGGRAMATTDRMLSGLSSRSESSISR